MRLGGHPSADAVLAAICATLAWGPLMRKRVSRLTVECLPPWLQLFGTLIGASVDASRHEPARFCGIDAAELLGRRSLTEIAFVALLGRQPSESDLFAFQTLVGMLLTNGPGTISAQGAKGAVSSDGPESPERVQLNKAMLGFLTHCGYAHGGNGYEGVAFLIEQFEGSGLDGPGRCAAWHRPAARWPARYVQRYAEYKSGKKNDGSLDIQKIPGVNHPVFKDKPVNHDPREVFIARQAGRARRAQRLPRLLPCAGAGAVRRRRVAHRVLRQHRRGDRRAAAEDGLARPAQRQHRPARRWRRRPSRSSSMRACSAAPPRPTTT